MPSPITTIPIELRSTSNPMLNFNRRATEAREKMARAEKRAADAEETIARHLGDFLRDEEAPTEGTPVRPCKNVTPPKKEPPRR